MSDNKLQANRFEFKYLVSEETAADLKRHVQMKLRPDPFTSGAGYYVHSLYLDAPDLRLCYQTVCGEKNRFKLRIRLYDDQPDHPVFLEVKRRVTSAVLKKRACIHRQHVSELLDGFVPRRRFLAIDDPKNFDGLVTFCELARLIRAQPSAYTSYLREAFESSIDNSQRITFDRQLRAGEFNGRLSCAGFEEWPLAPVDGVVFEMKFTNRFPEWMHETATHFQLDRISVPKYVECVNIIDEQRAKDNEGERRFLLDSPLRIRQ